MTVARTAVLLLLAACAPESAGVVHASGVTVYAPLPGRDTAVAYLILHNDTGGDVTVTGATSAAFEAVELHETRLVDGVSTMRELASVTVPAGETLAFEPGGRHLMLRRPTVPLDIGTRISLRLYATEGPILEVSARLEGRGGTAGSDASATAASALTQR